MFTKIIQLFNQWSKLKIYIHLHKASKVLYFREKQIWWASIGQNIGVEINGKNHNFERPVIVLKKFNEEAFLGVALSSRSKVGLYYFRINGNTPKPSVVNLSQIKLMSSKRLIRKISEMSSTEFDSIRRLIKEYL